MAGATAVPSAAGMHVNPKQRHFPTGSIMRIPNNQHPAALHENAVPRAFPLIRRASKAPVNEPELVSTASAMTPGSGSGFGMPPDLLQKSRRGMKIADLLILLGTAADSLLVLSGMLY